MFAITSNRADEKHRCVIPNKNADEVCGSVYKFLIKMLMTCGISVISIQTLTRCLNMFNYHS